MKATKEREIAQQAATCAETAVVIAAHGDRGGAREDRAMRATVAHLRTAGRFKAVTGGLLKGAPLIEDAVREAAASGVRRLLVYPLFMAKGYFVDRVLKGRLEALALSPAPELLPPLGADPALAELAKKRALACAEAHGLPPSECRLLVVGHGSKVGSASADATRALAARLAEESAFAAVEVALLEEAPFLAPALARSGAEAEPSWRATVVLGFFSGAGMHGGDDVPAAIAETGARAVYTGAIGTDPDIPAIIARSLARQCA